MNLKYFKVKLRPWSFGCEHEKALLKQVDGMTLCLTEEVRPGFFLSDFEVPKGTPNSDYAHEGQLLIMPSKDGHWVKGS